MDGTKQDITTDADVRILVDSFYDKVLRDDLLRPVFVDVVGLDFQKHLPTMYSFWSSMLFAAGTYRGQPYPVHERLKAHLTPEHFDRWLKLFGETLDEHFEGETARRAKERAENIAWIFQSKMGMVGHQ